MVPFIVYCSREGAMSGEVYDGTGVSLFHGLIGRPRPLWVTLAMAMILILIPIGAAILDGFLADLFREGYWRVVYLSSAVILYILIVGPILSRAEIRVVEAFRPLVQVRDDAFEQLVRQASRVNPIVETGAFALGASLGLWFALTGLDTGEVHWLELWLILSGILMFGLLGWAVYAALAGTRLVATLHRQPLRIDIFDTKPFEPIGRQSLAIALVFVGGILLSMVFGLGQLDIFAWQSLVVYLLLALVIVLAFFLNMRDTHRVLAAAKRGELEKVKYNLLQASRTLTERMSAGESTGTLGPDINALVVYESRVRAARTWPYDTAMLRTLFFSLIIPAAVELSKLIFGTMF
jgi:MFS family permease